MSLNHLKQMAHSPVRNYVIPGLTSWLIGNPGPAGTVRLFHSEREHQECIVPHSHRFDFEATVLRGTVRNIIWRKSVNNGDWFMSSTQTYGGDFGEYSLVEGEIGRYERSEDEYAVGETYRMRHRGQRARSS
jgi:hypothetical protein